MAELDSTQALGSTPHQPDNSSPNSPNISAAIPSLDVAEYGNSASVTENGHLDPAPGISSLNAPAAASTSIHSKKFASSNINRKFLEKTNSGSPSVPVAAQSSASKGGLSTPKPALTANPSHSRLVTTKLTAGPQPSVVTGPSWSRSQTGTPSPAPPNGAPTPSQAATSIAAAPGISQSSAPGKIIQPAARPSNAINAGPSKPAWRTAKSGTLNGPSRISDFPTVSELAKEREEMEASALRATESKAARKEELQQQADTFRGVHLDPKAHHWDEMIEDDSFLDGVLEFGDGKQYTVTPSLQTAFQLGAPAVSEPDAPPGPAPKEVSADDFDRSWPQSSHATQHNQRNRDLPPHTTTPSGSATPRTLFNERSNRMEPVPVSKTVIPNRWKEEDTPQGFMKRGNSVSHSGVERSLPPHMSQSGMQVLRKPTVVNETSPMEENLPVASPRASTQSALSSRHEPPHFNKQTSETPAHSLVRPNLDTRPSATEAPRSAPRRPDLPPPRPSRQPSDSLPKVTSGRSAAAASSTTTDVASKDPPPEDRPQIQTPAEPVLSYEEASKTMMQISAERARQRRQMEEEERIKAQERARQKAADLERELAQRTLVADTTVLDNGSNANAVKDSNVTVVLEDAQKITGLRMASSPTVTPSVPPVNRPTAISQPSNGSIVVAPPQSTRRPSLHTTPSTSDTGSWRTGRPLPDRVARPILNPRRDSDASVISPMHPKIEHQDLGDHNVDGSPIELRPTLAVRPSHSQSIRPVSPVSEAPSTSKASNPYIGVVASVEVDKDEVLEEIDFQDLDKFVDATLHTPRLGAPTDHTSQPPHIPQQPAVTLPRSEGSSWRRAPMADPQFTHAVHTFASTNRPGDSSALHQPGSARVTAKPNIISLPAEQNPDSLQPSIKSPRRATAPLRSPRSPVFREAPMSTLDYTISRIRGAIDGMHAEDDIKSRATETQVVVQERPNRIVAPRPGYVPVPSELPVTSVEAPQSPKPAWNTAKLSLPKHAPKGALHGKQVRFLREEPDLVSFDILSWNPPVAGMSRRSFSLNAVLFPRTFKNGRVQYPVKVPSSGKVADLPPIEEETREWKPIVKLPPRVHDLRAPALPLSRTTSTVSDAASGLETISRSPPPDHNAAKPPESHTDGKDLANQQRGRSQPRMPEGSGVAFYRTPTTDATKPSGVNFIVNSELEDAPSGRLIENSVALVSVASQQTSSAPTPTSNVVQTLSPNVVLDSVVPSDKPSPAKELAHRLPDPEHLRAVWSQVSNSSDVPTANSLKGIADDLTAIPFTLHEVKSEDGGTPPPGTLPSRMSIHDVTRAFQKVPAGSSGSPSHAPISPPSNVQSLRRPSYGFPSPSTGSGSRPLYPAYHPQAMGSPAPAMVYPAHVAPGMTRPMVPGTHSSQPQPGMWVQVPHPPGPTTPIGTMQYMSTPYSPQVVGYGNMNMHPGMYMQQMPNGAGTPAATPQHHHGHAMPPPLTPVITQPVPGYPTNPYQPYPSPVTPGGRGMLPNNSHSSMSPRQTPHTHSAPYNPVPASYGRPAW